MKVEDIPEEVRDALRIRLGGSPFDESHDAEIEAMSVQETFIEYCEHGGLENWGEHLIEVMDELEKKSPRATKKVMPRPRSPGRPPGSACEFHAPMDKSVRCLKTARVKLTQNIRGVTHFTIRCWLHYVRIENTMRNAREGHGNIVHVVVL